MNPGLAARWVAAVERWTPLSRWTLAFLLLLALSLLLRARTFGNPVIHIDEQFYLLVGDRMLDGALPYVDIWDRKPVGIFLIFAAIRLLGGDGIVQYQIVATLFAAATALLGARMAVRFAPFPAALLAAACYIIWLNLLGGQGGQSPVFYNLTVALSASLTLAAIGRERFDGRALRYGILAMLIAGLSIQIKYTVLFEGMFFGLALLWRAHRSGWHPARLAALALAWAVLGILPTGAAYGWFAMQGHGEAFVQANFVSIFHRGREDYATLAARFALIAGLTAPLLLCALAGRRRRGEAEPAQAQAHGFALWWAGAAIAGFLLFGTYHHHYGLPLLVPLAAAAAPALGRWRSGIVLPLPGRRFLIPFMLFVPLFGLAAQEAVLAVYLRYRGDRADFHALAHWVRPRLRPGECVYIFGGDPLLYQAAGSCLPTRWSFPDHLNSTADARAIGVEPVAELRRILACRPRFVIVSDRAFRNGYAPSLGYIRQELRRNWRLVHVGWAGRLRRLVYEPRPARRDIDSSAQPCYSPPLP